MEKMEKLSMLSQPGVCKLECVPVGGIDCEKETLGKQRKIVFDVSYFRIFYSQLW